MAAGYFNPYKSFNGCFVPEWLCERPDISAGAKLVYARLAQFSDKSTGEAWPHQQTLSTAIGVSSPRQCRRYLSELESAGLIEPQRRGLGKTNAYRFLWHGWMAGHTRLGEPLMSSQERTDLSSQERTDLSSQERTDLSSPIKVEKNHRKESVEKKRGVRARPRSRPETNGQAGTHIGFFVFDDDLKAWTAKQYPGMPIGPELEAFRDYHEIHGTVSRSWPASWRSWCRNWPKYGSQKPECDDWRKMAGGVKF